MSIRSFKRSILKAQGKLVSGVQSNPALRQVFTRANLIAFLMICVFSFTFFGLGHASHAQASFSIDVSGMLSTASSLFNQLFPIFGAIAGMTLAFGLVAYVIAEIRKAF